MAGMPAPYPTRALRESELTPGFPGGVLVTRHALDARYAWDAGQAIGGFLEGLAAGRILGRRCGGCERVLVPPRMFCEECFRPTEEWVQLPDVGTVVSHSLCRVAWDLAPRAVPQICALIELDGRPSARLFHILGNVSPARVTDGLRVRAIWRPRSERTASILDIRHWEIHA